MQYLRLLGARVWGGGAAPLTGGFKNFLQLGFQLTQEGTIAKVASRQDQASNMRCTASWQRSLTTTLRVPSDQQ